MTVAGHVTSSSEHRSVDEGCVIRPQYPGKKLFALCLGVINSSTENFGSDDAHKVVRRNTIISTIYKSF